MSRDTTGVALPRTDLETWLRLRAQVTAAHPSRGGSAEAFRAACAHLQTFQFWTFGWPATPARRRCACGCQRAITHSRGRPRQYYSFNCQRRAAAARHRARRRLHLVPATSQSA